MKSFSDFLVEAKLTDTTRWIYYTPDVMSNEEISETFQMTPIELENILDARLGQSISAVFFKYMDRKEKDTLFVELTYRQPAVVGSKPSEMASDVGKDGFKSQFAKWASTMRYAFNNKKVDLVFSEVYRSESNKVGKDKSIYRDHIAHAIFRITNK